jgi:hypothetical protein
MSRLHFYSRTAAALLFGSAVQSEERSPSPSTQYGAHMEARVRAYFEEPEHRKALEEVAMNNTVVCRVADNFLSNSEPAATDAPPHHEEDNSIPDPAKEQRMEEVD